MGGEIDAGGDFCSLYMRGFCGGGGRRQIGVRLAFSEGVKITSRRVGTSSADIGFGLDIAHLNVYACLVKKRELEKSLRKLGWELLRHGGAHDIWTDGERQEAVPRHPEINERLARAILRRAKGSKKS